MLNTYNKYEEKYLNYPEPNYSDVYKEKIAALLKRMSGSSSYVKPKFSKTIKVLIAAIIILSLLSIVAYAVPPIREALNHFIIEEVFDGSIFHFQDDASTKGFLKADYTYIPDGYTQTDYDETKTSQYIVYTNSEGAIIVINTIKNAGSESFFNTEGVELISVEVDGTKGLYCYNNGSSMLSWIKGSYNTTIVAEGLNEQEVIKIANSRVEEK